MAFIRLSKVLMTQKPLITVTAVERAISIHTQGDLTYRVNLMKS